MINSPQSIPGYGQKSRCYFGCLQVDGSRLEARETRGNKLQSHGNNPEGIFPTVNTLIPPHGVIYQIMMVFKISHNFSGDVRICENSDVSKFAVLLNFIILY